MTEPRIYYRRHLPHWQPPDATYHVTFRLDGSLPKHAIEELRDEREEMQKQAGTLNEHRERDRKLSGIQRAIFEKYEALLDGNSTGPHWLKDQAIAEVVREAIHHRDQVVYDLLSYTIMPNHVHIIFTICKDRQDSVPTNRPYVLTQILESLKKHTALECNKILHRTGAFWQHESYDHVIRNAKELEQTIWYVINNPVKAGFAKSWEEWPWSYLKPGLMEF
ncbi:MAG: transposase [Candidatus Kryptoniota bacterium]